MGARTPVMNPINMGLRRLSTDGNELWCEDNVARSTIKCADSTVHD
jgi:hypothetical protein